MKLKVIGTGSSGNCYVLTNNSGRSLLLDAGVPFKKIREALGYDLSMIDGVLLTHLHQDHSKAMHDIQRAGFPIITEEQSAFALFGELPYNMAHKAPGGPCSTGDWTVRSFPIEHDCIAPVGFLIASCKPAEITMYLTDTGFTQYVPARLDHLIIECSYIDDILDGNKAELGDRYLRLKKHHFSLDRVVRFLESIKHTDLKTITLVHMSATNADPDRMAERIAQVTGIVPNIARAGKEFILSEV